MCRCCNTNHSSSAEQGWRLPAPRPSTNHHRLRLVATTVAETVAATVVFSQDVVATTSKCIRPFILRNRLIIVSSDLLQTPIADYDWLLRSWDNTDNYTLYLESDQLTDTTQLYIGVRSVTGIYWLTTSRTPFYSVTQKKRNHFSFMNTSFNTQCNLTKFSTLIVNEYYRRC